MADQMMYEDYVRHLIGKSKREKLNPIDAGILHAYSENGQLQAENDKCVKARRGLIAKNTRWEKRYIEAVNDMAELKRIIANEARPLQKPNLQD